MIMELKNLDTELLIEELQNRGYIRVFWHRDDIINVAETQEITLNEDEIGSIMTEIEERHDANYGVNWEFITICIYDVVSNREKI